MQFLIHTVLMLLALLWIVPAATGHEVMVRRESAIRGFFALILIGVANAVLWTVLTVFTLGLAVAAQALTFGIFGLLVNGLAITLIGKVFPSVLYVRSYSSAFLAAIVLTICSYFIHMI